jgi:hypothetical protein
MRNGRTSKQYSYYRAIFGAYLFIHFAQLLPWGAELFSNRGVLPQSSASPLIHLFPNILALWDSPAFVQSLLIAAGLLSLLFAFGIRDKAAAIGIWYVWACLLGRNPLISNPSIPFIGWLLLAHTLIPATPGLLRKQRIPSDWAMPPGVFGSAWVVMALGYAYSGYTKLVCQSWMDGSALSRVLHNPLARTGMLHNAALGMPPVLLSAATWAGLALELTFAPLACFRILRPWIWAAMLGLHLTLLVLINFADLSAGMIVLHLFTFDPAWISSSQSARPVHAADPRIVNG